MRAKESVEKVGAKILGTVINSIPIDAKGGGYYYYSDEEFEDKSKLRKTQKGLNINV